METTAAVVVVGSGGGSGGCSGGGRNRAHSANRTLPGEPTSGRYISSCRPMVNKKPVLLH